MSNKPRPVTVYDRGDWNAGKQNWDKKNPRPAVFHQFGIDYDEYDGGPGNYTCAVIENPDGTIELVPVDLVVFITTKEERLEV